ncbi:MAG: hypothetical protein H8E36_01480 [Rhodospirillaceae bacterium]|nr:hypothetical protein [Rhodospirillaceae bacterium]MBL6942685.1 hypothetical protein [Rhodospirillales bacterium]
MMVDEADKIEPKKPAEKPISLKPLGFEEAVTSLLKVKPSKKEPENGGENDSIK